MELVFLNINECQPLIARPAMPITEALSKIEQNRGLPLIVLDARDRCAGLVTDGALRRLILEKNSLESSLRNLPSECITAPEQTSVSLIRSLMNQEQIVHLPVTDSSGGLTGMWMWRSLENLAEAGPALLLAGGKGLRLRPLTLTTPKPLIPVGGVPLLDRAIKACSAHGVKDIYVSVNYLAERVIDHLKAFEGAGISLTVLKEESPLGTAGAVGLVSSNISSPLLVMNSDLLHSVDFSSMRRFHDRMNADMTVGSRIFESSIPFGVLDVSGTRVVGIKEKPVFSSAVSAGIYLLGPRVRALVERNENIDMPQLVERALEEDLDIHTYITNEYWLDVGTAEALQLAEEMASDVDSR